MTLIDEEPKTETMAARGTDSPAAKNHAHAIHSVTPPPSVVPKPKKRWRPTGKQFAWAVFLACIAVGGKYGYDYWKWANVHETTDDAFIDAHIMGVSPRVSGHVQKIYVTDNQQVKAGDLLLELDARDYQVEVDQAQAKLAVANADVQAYAGMVEQTKAMLAEAQAALEQHQAQVESEEAELARAKSDYRSYEIARKSGVVSNTEWQKIQTDVQTRTAAVNAAQKVVLADRSKIAASQATISAAEGKSIAAEAAIQQAQAALEAARLRLSYTKVYASEDGHITKKNVEPGNFVTPSTPLMAIVSPEMWVTANYKETQLTHMQAGQEVEIHIDAYPGQVFKGKVDSIQRGSGARFSLLPPENATGNYVKVVQRVPVKIVFENHPEATIHLGPGMSVEPAVCVGERVPGKPTLAKR